ncbi:AVAST type 2 anti-phage system protein Avs2 [Ignatzschineria cameli]|uniref:ATP-binding protein n=1 Tax=Ignatzschineria cameli TaxID=2182793 RepID=A0A2U2ATD9_9GAMM|nr:AVAST type 2 anti-phage system protein Avs2 [Ignatzschineria cameli]PWD88001.1 ATP-binding protein [Ignatzschineria cameli]PWD91033.1 ATP-binding protein [Ignatzschineria cameli]PWD92675.1 ATP-binding protein [Ignatzschineria cameli]PWD93695.1 ATP-binding protein [Ignatzschineria cameli]
MKNSIIKINTNSKHNDDIGGTGFFINQDHILTACHVIKGRVDIATIEILVNGTYQPYKFELVAYDEFLDIALLKIIDTGEYNLNIIPLQLYRKDLHEGDIWNSFGFPKVHRETGQPINGAIIQTNLNPEIDTYEIKLKHNEQLRDFSGFSGSPLIINEQVIGILIRQEGVYLGAISISVIHEFLKKNNISTQAAYREVYLGGLDNEKLLIDQAWFTRISKKAINDLGNRYSQEINFEFEDLNIFEALGQTDQFINIIEKRLDKLVIVGRDVDSSLEKYELGHPALTIVLTDLIKLTRDKAKLKRTIPLEDIKILIQQLNKYQGDILELIKNYNNELSKRNLSDEEKNKLLISDYIKRKLYDFLLELYSFEENLNKNQEIEIYNNPILVIAGNAGIGKSHLIGDAISKRINKNMESLFLLGQHFLEKKVPWQQILSQLGLEGIQSNNFLEKFNEYGEKRNQRVILAIDAINEGAGRYFWPDNILSFIQEIQKYPYIALVLSIRSSYTDLIFPKEYRKKLNINFYYHQGFSGHEFEASKLFFKNYHIELPKIPLLHPEFQNPLFLKLFCEGLSRSGLTSIQKGFQGITKINELFIDSLNKYLSTPNQLNYCSKSLNLVQDAINAFITRKYETQSESITYRDAYRLIDNSVKDFISEKGFIEHLISGGILTKDYVFDYNSQEYSEIVYVAYERLEDHLYINKILRETEDIQNLFSKVGPLHYCFSSDVNLYRYRGVIDALSIQLPELFNIELYQLVTLELKEHEIIRNSWIDSLLWRKHVTVADNILPFLNENVLPYEDSYNHFFDTQISLSNIPNFYLNSNWLHKNLLSFSLIDRDTEWTAYLNNNYKENSSIDRLIRWAREAEDFDYVSDESLLLTSITLSWFLTSTTRHLRDHATKALVNILTDRLHLVKDLLQKFEGVNDLYVYERLFAVAYGVVLRSNDKESLKELSHYIFQIIFKDKTAIIPNVLLRDYACNIIEYTNYLQIFLEFDIEEVRPPYHSEWPDNLPTLEELKIQYKDDPEYRVLWHSVMSGSDFARYIIGTNHGTRDWSGNKKDEEPTDRELVFKKFKESLTKQQLDFLNALDPNLYKDAGIRGISYSVSAGKKSTEEIEKNQKNFRESLTQEELNYFEQLIEPFLSSDYKRISDSGKYFDLRTAQIMIFLKVIELGWSNSVEERARLNTPYLGRMDTRRIETLRKKYQWIAYYEYKARLSDNFHMLSSDQIVDYLGAWQLSRTRNIDPALMVQQTSSYYSDYKETWWNMTPTLDWESSDDEWISSANTEIEVASLLNVQDENDEEWLVLESHPSWKEKKILGADNYEFPRKEYYLQLHSYLVRHDQYLEICEQLTKQDFPKECMPSQSGPWNIFSHEFYWSPAYQAMLTHPENGYKNKFWQEISESNYPSKPDERYIGDCIVTTQKYSSDDEYDASKESSISFLKPALHIVEHLQLSHGIQDGEMVDSKGNVICKEMGVDPNSPPCLLIKKQIFLEYLQQNELKIIWTVQGERLFIGGDLNHDKGRLNINGIYGIKSDSQKVYEINIKKFTEHPTSRTDE